MVKPVICNSDSATPSFPEFCDDGLWEVPVNSLSDIKEANRDHAYILPNNSVWVLSYDGTRFIQLNLAGSGGSGQPTLVSNSDGLIEVSGSGTYDVHLNLDKAALKEELAIDDLSEVIKNHINDENVHVSTEEKNEWTSKQNRLTAGENIMIDNDRISADLRSKQDVLVSGETIKTINGEALLGSGNIVISGGSADYLDKSDAVSFNETSYFSIKEMSVVKQARTVFFQVNLESIQTFSFSRNAVMKVGGISDTSLFPSSKIAVNMVTENPSTAIYANTAITIETNGDIMLVNTSDVSIGTAYNFRVGNTHCISMTYITA
ncbi:hypothetical protein [Candidatus Enterococcus clewellii]|uniref:Uncharacterized protein n=1 Tax=Candidatus Enterococcus clewellii TaxID=1834193 RepID=A0A242K245_9ENTE|nr:hypothetical protein [Enterococcus sp. 9E7_DIV0242]OTP12662.1 hypothetical protein A5888_003240 [Enterococcus sp. 9E7_DIV0242]